MHTHMNRPNRSLDWVLSHWADFTVLRFIFVFCVSLYIAWGDGGGGHWLVGMEWHPAG